MVDDGTAAAPELLVDWVGSIENAAKVIAGLHPGEKRLVFCDSRARVEELTAALREAGVTTHVSHSSLSRDERHRAEQAFAEDSDCVIVATSTLELGIDVGDLDRVIQIDAPATVAAVLQRTGRTGRRPGTRRNCLFLCTRDDGFWRALALCVLVADGWVEPLEGPPHPLHLGAQQLLARVLAAGRVGDSEWPGTLGRVARQAGLRDDELLAVREQMVADGVLVRDGPWVAIGPVGEERYGRRHFMEVTSLFLSAPLLLVRWGARELGWIDPSALLSRDGRLAVILLGGQAWAVREVDWKRRVAWVEPSEDVGRSRWAGAGQALSFAVAQAVRRALAEGVPDALLTGRARARFTATRDEMDWVSTATTTLERDRDRQRARWWTWPGARANSALGAALADGGLPVAGVDDLGIGFAGVVGVARLREALSTLPPDLVPPVDPRELEGLKFSECLPREAALGVLRARKRDVSAVASVLGEPIAAV